MTRYFFDQDSSSHWYMIPETCRERWDELSAGDEDEVWEEVEEEFSEFRLDGGIRYYSFIDPSLTK